MYVTRIAFDFRVTSQVLRSRKPLQTIVQRLGCCVVSLTITHDLNGGLDCAGDPQVQGNVPEGVDCRGNVAASLTGQIRVTYTGVHYSLAFRANDIRLESARENLVNDAVTSVAAG